MKEKILRTHKVRIYPTTDQQTLLDKSFDLARFAWNIALQEWNSMYKEYIYSGKTKEKPSAYTIRNRFVKYVKPLRPWISIPSKESYANSILDLGKAWNNYFTHIAKGKPKFKSKHRSKKSFKMVSIKKGSLEWKQNRLYIPKFRKKNYIKTAEFSRYHGELKNVTISKVGNKYYASCLFELKDSPANEYNIHANRISKVGIDLGIKMFASLSDGKQIKSINTNRIDKKIKKLQKKLSKTNKCSHKHQKVIIKLQNAYAHKANMLNDNIQKVTTYLIQNYEQINIENLKPSNMMKNHSLARRIADGQFYKFKIYLKYKIERLNQKGKVGSICLVNPMNTTQKCSQCGHKQSHKLELSDRTLICEKCGFTCDRDLNAAINIKNLA